MLLNPYRFGVAYTGLDVSDYSGDSPILVVSLRRIDSSYTGALVRLRRSTDNAELDYGAGLAMGEFIDYSAIDTWLGGGTAYVVTWYDQSGQGRDITNSTTADQPILSASATTDRAVKWDGVNDHLSSAQIVGGWFSSGPALSIHHATDNSDTGFATNMSLGTSPTSGSGTLYFRTNRYASNHRFAWQNVNLSPTPGAVAGNEYNYYHHDGTNRYVDLNATQSGTVANTTTANAGGDTFHLGSDAGGNPWDGYTYELIIFDASQATLDSNIIRDFMNITYSLY